jgi:hypothetical protein
MPPKATARRTIAIKRSKAAIRLRIMGIFARTVAGNPHAIRWIKSQALVRRISQIVS